MAEIARGLVPAPTATGESMAVSVPLWPLPAVAALLPALAVVLVLTLYTGQKGVFCNPFVQDCISISRMAKAGLANQVFRAGVLPGAALQLLTWMMAVHALAAAGLPRRQAKLMSRLGIAAAAMLVVYGSFLGSDGAAYQWLRHWGTATYFSGTYFAMLLFARSAERLHRSDGLAVPRLHLVLLQILLLFITCVCLVHAAVLVSGAKSWVHRLENLTEWWSALAMTLVFLTIADLWRRWGVRADVRAQHALQGQSPIAFRPE
jgi:hypothetical protein